MQNLKEKLKEFYWQLELLLEVRPDAVAAVLDVLDMATGPSDRPLSTAKAVLGEVISYGPDGMRSFLSNLCSQFCEKSTGPLEAAMVGYWKSLIDLIADDPKRCDDLFSSRQIPVWISTPGAEFTTLFEPIQLYKYGQSRSLQNPARDIQSKRIFELLVSSGPYRRFGFTVGTLERLDQLKPKVANFSHVIDYVMDAVALAMRYHRPVDITPMLLVGDPGIGKTYFTGQLAQCLGVPRQRLAMDNFQTGPALAGSSYIYMNSDTGMVFKALSEGNHISPLIILDEIDKANDTLGYSSDSLSPLHNLLEPESAKMFEDASFSLQMDASHMIWIATANYIGKIPETIKSRFVVFDIRSQSCEMRSGVIREMCAKLMQEYPGIEFDEELFGELNTRTPREQRQMLLRALGRASRLGESKVTLIHLKEVLAEELERANAKNFGFQSRAG